MTSRYILRSAFNKNGDHLFRPINVVESDIEKSILWDAEHRKGREFVKRSFCIIRYEWGLKKLPLADHPSSSNPFGVFSKKAVDALGAELEKHGDLYHLDISSGEDYFLYDCWSFVHYNEISTRKTHDGKSIKVIEIADTNNIPSVFSGDKWPGLIVTDAFKQIAESTGLTGMVFSPVEIIVTD